MTTTTLVLPVITSCGFNKTSVIKDEYVRAIQNVTNGTYPIDAAWFAGAGIAFSSGNNSGNYWFDINTGALEEGNYSLVCWVNDTKNNSAHKDSASMLEIVTTTTTEPTTSFGTTTTTSSTTQPTTTLAPLARIYGHVYINETRAYVPKANVTITCLSNSDTFNGTSDERGYYIISIHCPYQTMVLINVSSGPHDICLSPGKCIHFAGGTGSTSVKISTVGYAKANIYLAPGNNIPTTTTTTATTTTTLPNDQCTLQGDYPPCGKITVEEIINLVIDWRDGKESLMDLRQLLNAFRNDQA